MHHAKQCTTSEARVQESRPFWLAGEVLFTKDIAALVKELLAGFSPLGKGFLTGKINEHTTFDPSDIRSRNPRFTPEAIKANQVVIDLLARIGAQKQATPAQIALAWLLAQKPWIVPIPGSRKIERLEENIGAVQVDLTESDLQEIDSAIATIIVLGNRH